MKEPLLTVRLSALAVVTGVLCVTSVAWGAEGPADTTSTKVSSGNDATWSVGAGIGLANSVVAVVPLNAVQLAPAPVVQPTATTSIERRLSHASWLFLTLAGSYRDEGGLIQFVATSLGGAAGWRRVMWQNRWVAVSGYVALGAAYDDQHEKYSGVSSHTTSWDARVDLGTSIDCHLSHAIARRFATSLVRAIYSLGNARATANAPNVPTHDFYAGVQLNPALELRAFF